ncbi:MAG: glucosidase, partial [Myxococcales bacterium]|nr:glucosidase [Myxococcales bacterium]
MTGAPPDDDPERQRLDEDERRTKNWTRWGPYLSERQWGTVREDYSPDGTCWDYLPHDHARSRAYRWGEDGLLGITDRECRMCFALALWNGHDPILKERLFGLTGPEGNHGEDVKELYYYLDATPTSSYLAALYKYPQAAYPYAELVEENRRRGRDQPEYDVEDTGVFDDNRYFDVLAEYAKASPSDVLIRITVSNRGPEAAPLHLLPTVWQRNTWSWGRTSEGYWPRGELRRHDGETVAITHPSLGRYRLTCEGHPGAGPRLLFTENETNFARLYGVANPTPYVKDAFHRVVVDGDDAAANPEQVGTKAAAWYRLSIPAGREVVIRLRLSSEAEAAAEAAPLGADFDALFVRRKAEADRYHLSARDEPLDDAERRIVRQADAGLMWSKQFYHYIVEHWLEGDPGQPVPQRREQRNKTWRHLWARDLIAMPDKWEYPWFAAWDTAFHCVAMARVDPAFAKKQILLLCREWYMHPSGQLPAYEFAFDDVNPPVHAWAAWRVFQLDAQRGKKDRLFLERAFQKCLINFTWWVNREDLEGDNLFSGGFLGLDNVGVFDRSKGLPGGGRLEQADATAWMAFYCTTMLAIALELATEDPAYGDVASKFFEHFVTISKAINELGGTGLWDEQDGFYYDVAFWAGHSSPLRIRSMVGLIPLFAVESLDAKHLERHPLFRERMEWFLDNRPDLASSITCLAPDATSEHRLLAVPSRQRLERVLRYLLDEDEFLSPYGIRSLSRYHKDHPYVLELDGERREVHYTPGESDSGLFGGNSNWRGPIWFPVNYLLVEALKRFHHFYRDTLKVECPTGSGHWVDLRGAAEEIERRLCKLFRPDDDGQRPCHGRSVHHAR